MANVISSVRTVQERLLAAWQTQQAAAKTRQQAAPTETSRATTSFRALFSGKAAAALPAAQGSPLGPATAVAVALPVAQPAVQTVAAAALLVAQSALPAAASAALPAAQPAVPAVAAAALPAAPATEQESVADASAQDAPPTAESVFGANPWMTDPTVTAPNGNSYSYNPLYFATASTASQVAQMVGGTVVASDQTADAGGFIQQQPNEMVKLSNGTLINPGLVASFYNYGFSQSIIDRMIANEVNGT